MLIFIFANMVCSRKLPDYIIINERYSKVKLNGTNRCEIDIKWNGIQFNCKIQPT
jgi:hypothetical protein